MTDQDAAGLSASTSGSKMGRDHSRGQAPSKSANSRLAPGLLILERHPRLELALKRELANPLVLVRPCRSPQDLWVLAERMPESVCVLDWSGWPTETLALLDRLQKAPCGARPIIVGPTELAPLEWAARESGAVGFFAPLTEPDHLIALCQRLLASFQLADDPRR